MRNSRLLLLPKLFVPAALMVSLALAVAGVKAQVRQNTSLEEKRQSEQINEQRLGSLMSAVGIQVDPTNRATSGPNYQAIRLQLTTVAISAGASNSLTQTFSTGINSTERRAGQLPRHRSLELSSQHLVVLTVDSENRLRWWSLIPDPRLLRAERPDANNRLSGEVVYRPNIEAVVEIPDDTAATELRFYHPQWTDDRFVLTLVSSVGLNKN